MENGRVVIWGGTCQVSQVEDMLILLFMVISIRSSNFMMFLLLASVYFYSVFFSCSEYKSAPALTIYYFCFLFSFWL